MHKPSSLRDYIIALLIGASVTVFLGLYLYIRRGYLFDAPPTADPFYVPNKAIAGAGVILLAFTFLAGPLSRYFDHFDPWLGYRKEIGIIGAMLLLVHGLGSSLLLPLKFAHPVESLSYAPLEYGAGIAGLALLMLLFASSFPKMIALMGPERWWFFQRWGLRLVILATLIHLIGLKWAGWWKWFTVGVPPTAELANPTMVPASLLAGLFIGWVVIIRLYESLCLFRNIGFTTKEIAIDPQLRARGRAFFVYSGWFLIAAYVVVLTRWYW